MSGVGQVDTNIERQVFRIIGSREISIQEIQNALSSHGFAIRPILPSTLTVGVSGMTCRSCELTVERKWKNLPGVKKVNVNCATGLASLTVDGNPPSIGALQQAIGDNKYTVHHSLKKAGRGVAASSTRPTFWELVGLFALVLFVGKIFSSLGLFKSGFAVSDGMGFGAIFLIGLVAASSSCIAVVGGLLLSSAAKFNERYSSARPIARMRPVVLFVLGRIVSYTLLGGLLGVIGGILTPSPYVTALITIVAALYMLVMGLDMLHIAPVWLKKIMPRLPKSLSHRIMDAEGKEHPVTPFALGAGTFFLPCGFTQALQLYALTTGDFGTSAIMLLAFALGTAPALLALGYASSSLKGKAGQFFFRFSGALVVVLGLCNIQNGFTIAGYPLSFSVWRGDNTVQAAEDKPEEAVPVVDGVQIAKMTVGYGGYEPDHLIIRAGIPVQWEVDATNAGGCLGVLVSRELGIQQVLDQGINKIEFTPQTPGEVAFSCSMGMFRGSFTVL